MGLLESHKHPQTHIELRFGRNEFTFYPLLESCCSVMSRPGKTGRRTPTIEIGIFDPEVKLIDASASLEVRLAPGLEVPNETSLGCVDDPVAIITGLAYCSQWSTHLNNLVYYH